MPETINTPVLLSLIVPTLNEAANLPVLMERVDQAMRGAELAYEVIVVDDGSTDGTGDVARALGQQYAVQVIERGRDAEGGLSGAVLAGFDQARGDVLAVMDADLQHPPEALPALVNALHGAELAIGSRYTAGGAIGEEWSVIRRLMSRIATFLGRPFAQGIADPMSGFFALPRSVYARGRHLSPLGYKILLELLAKCQPASVVEVPIRFERRVAGESKLTAKEQFRYLEHLSRLYDYHYPRKSPIVKFLIVVIAAWMTAAGVFALVEAGIGLTLAMAMAYTTGIGVAGVFHARYVKTQRRFLIRPTPWRDFGLSAMMEWSVAVTTAAYLSYRASVPRWEVFIIAMGLATLVRYVLRKELLLDVRGLRPDALRR